MFSRLLPRFLFSSLPPPTVYLRPLIFSKSSVSLRLKPIKGRYQSQGQRISLAEEGCLLFEFADQMKDHEGNMQINYSGRSSFKVALNQMSRFLGIDVFEKEKAQEFEIRIIFILKFLLVIFHILLPYLLQLFFSNLSVYIE